MKSRGVPDTSLYRLVVAAVKHTRELRREPLDHDAFMCDEHGRPKVKLHGLRMLNPTIFSHIPLASADSCNVALNIGKDVKWSGSMQPITESTRALVLAERIEHHAAATTWSKRRGTQMNLELIG